MCDAQDGGTLDATLRDSGNDDVSVGGGDAEAAAAKCRFAVDCSPERPICGPTGACVACTMNEHCPLAAPVCTANTCTRCATSAPCAVRPATPACEPISGACAACTSSEPNACLSAAKVCKTNATTCVECNQNADCKPAEAARCDANSCQPCASDDDCAHVDAKHACHQGTCVACTPATEAAHCGETACDPEIFACTTTRRGSLATCHPCRADSECGADRKCVRVPFGAIDTGYHCMQQVSAAVDCPLPYRAASLSASSRSGAAPTQYCAHNTNVTTCNAIVALTSDRPCTLATVETDCGPGALCGEVGGADNRCTYPCSSELECPEVAHCNEENAADPNPHCGGLNPR